MCTVHSTWLLTFFLTLPTTVFKNWVPSALSLRTPRTPRVSQGVSPPRLRVVRVPRGTRDKTHCLARRTRHIYVSLHTSHSPPPIALINHAPREIILHVDSYV